MSLISRVPSQTSIGFSINSLQRPFHLFAYSERVKTEFMYAFSAISIIPERPCFDEFEKIYIAEFHPELLKQIENKKKLEEQFALNNQIKDSEENKILDMEKHSAVEIKKHKKQINIKKQKTHSSVNIVEERDMSEINDKNIKKKEDNNKEKHIVQGKKLRRRGISKYENNSKNIPTSIIPLNEAYDEKSVPHNVTETIKLPNEAKIIVSLGEKEEAIGSKSKFGKMYIPTIISQPQMNTNKNNELNMDKDLLTDFPADQLQKIIKLEKMSMSIKEVKKEQTESVCISDNMDDFEKLVLGDNLKSQTKAENKKIANIRRRFRKKSGVIKSPEKSGKDINDNEAKIKNNEIERTREDINKEIPIMLSIQENDEKVKKQGAFEEVW